MLINLYPTLKCNLECKHCMHNCSPSRTEQISDENYAHFRRFISYVMSKGIRIEGICISGGEPMLYPKINAVLKDLNQLRMQYGISLSMCTNATIVPDKEFTDTLGELDFLLTTIRVSSSPFHDEEIAKRKLSVHMDKYFKYCQNLSVHRVVRIMDKGRAKQLISDNMSDFINPDATCVSRFNPAEEVNFKPNFISFCSEDDSLTVPDKYVYYDFFNSFVNRELAYDEIILRSRIFKTKQQLGQCPNICIHHTISKNYINRCPYSSMDQDV